MRHLSLKCGVAMGFIAFALLCCRSEYAWAQDQRSDIETLKRELEELRRRDEENRRQIEELQRKIEAIQAAPTAKPTSPETALEKAVQEAAPTPAGPTRPDLLSRQLGGATLRLLDLSLDVLFAVGWSSEPDASLQTLQGGAHDPRKRGFTFEQAELSLAGAVDPYFSGESHIVFSIDPMGGETETELEEAFLTTQSLPYGLQFKGGQFFTEFGRMNAQHPHQWDWQDQPIINTRLFGGDGLRAPGARVSWLTPLPWYSEVFVGAQNANGETLMSFLANEKVFEERPIGGRPFTNRQVKSPGDLLYLARWANSWNVTDEITSVLGVSGLFGPNATGQDGYTQIYGTDLKVTWRPVNNFRGWPFLLWQSELMGRWYKADRFLNASDPDNIIDLPLKTLLDWGIYAQALYGFSYRWAAGLRYEYASGEQPSVLVFNGRSRDPFRDNRLRLSPVLVWHPTEFSRIRLQYNYDRAEHLAFDGLGSRDRDAHSVWAGFEISYGAHAAHKY